MKYHDRISKEVKALVDINVVRREFKAAYEAKIAEGEPANFAAKKTRQKFMRMLVQRGVLNSKAAFLLHFTEVLPYNGCGCCEHRKY